MSDPPQDAERDPEERELLASVDAALAPYRDLLPPEALEEMKGLLEDVAFVHPTAALLRRRMAPRTHRTRSGDEPVEAADAPDEQAVKDKAGGDR